MDARLLAQEPTQQACALLTELVAMVFASLITATGTQTVILTYALPTMEPSITSTPLTVRLVIKVKVHLAVTLI